LSSLQSAFVASTSHTVSSLSSLEAAKTERPGKLPHLPTFNFSTNHLSIHQIPPLIHSSVHPAVRDVIHRVCGNVEITVGCTCDHSMELRMPVELHDFLLSLVDEEQLRSDLRFVLSPVGLRCVNIPQCKFVVFARGR